MPLIVETGAGVAGANSYVTVDEADAFFDDRNILNWAGEGATVDTKEGYLIQAADYLNHFFRWKGDALSADQAMGLPTSEIEVIPETVKHAQMLLAREAATTGPLASVMGERLVTRERKQLSGVGEKEVHYERSNVDPLGRVGSQLLAMLRPYAHDPGGIQQARVSYV